MESVTFPVATITKIVDKTVITITGIKKGCNCSQEAISPTDAGMNMTGMMSIKKLAVSLTALNFSFLDTNSPSIITNP